MVCDKIGAFLSLNRADKIQNLYSHMDWRIN